jgi:hypothetical protein
VRRLSLIGAPLLLLFGCSVLVKIDEDKYLPGNGDGDGNGGSGGAGVSSNGGISDMGGSGGSADGGLGGLTFGDGGGGAGGTGGTGGTVEIPEPRHYYPLDGNLMNLGTPDGDDNLLPEASISGGNWITSGAVSNQAFEVTTGHWLQLEPFITSQSPFTLSWWFVVTRDEYMALVSKAINTAGNGGYTVFSENSYINIRVDDVGYNKIDTPVMHPDAGEGVWTHIVLAFHENISATQDYLAVWVNGEIAEERTEVLSGDFMNNTAYVRFGVQEEFADPPSLFYDFEGVVDEIRVYNQVLTTDQVRALYDLDRN